MSTEELEEIALRHCTPAIQAWVGACRAIHPGIKRGDKPPLRLELPQENLAGYEVVGIYKSKNDTSEEFQLAYVVPMRVDMFQKPHWQCQQAQGIKHLSEVYRVILWRQEKRSQWFQPYPMLRNDVVFLATQRYQNLHGQVSPEQQSWPLSALRITFVLEGRERGVGREALILACMLEAEAVTFIPRIVAKTWASCSGKYADNIQVEQSTIDTHFHSGSQTLLDLCRVLQELSEFLKCVNTAARTEGGKIGRCESIRKEIAKSSRPVVADRQCEFMGTIQAFQCRDWAHACLP